MNGSEKKGGALRARAPAARVLAAALILAGLARAGASGTGNTPADAKLTDADSTESAAVAIPGALRSGVGQLWVPAKRFRNGYAEHFDEHCSAALVTTKESLPSRLLLSAWHCIEDYRDLSRDLLFETQDGRRHPARVVASGGGMHGDWAILRLRKPLPGGLLLTPPSEKRGDTHAMAGFPRRADGDAALVHARHCRVTGRDGPDLRSDCILSKGASGGAVVDAGDARVYRGVISRGDARSVSIFVPLTRFYRQLRPLLGTTRSAAPGS